MILHVYDNPGLFNDHPRTYNKRFYHAVQGPDKVRIVFKPTISGIDLKERRVTGRPRTVVPGEFVIVDRAYIEPK